MLSKRIGSLVVLAMLLVLVGCPPKPAPPVTVVALVTPSYGATGYGVEQLAQPGQILEWQTMFPVPQSYWVVFDPNANPCENAPKSLPGTPASPAQCTVAAQPSGQFVKYSYQILDHDPYAKPATNFNVTPCKGCAYSIGTAGNLGSSAATATAPAAPSGTPPATPPSPPPATGPAIKVDNPGEIDLSCVPGNPITVAPPAQTSKDLVFWQVAGNAFDWQVQINPPTGSQPQLCQGNQTTFSNTTSAFCQFNQNASGTYTYNATSSKCSASNGNTITVGTPSPSPGNP
jgi:hypothetical protein